MQIGDFVEISYNGEIMESYPAQLGEVYKITVIEQTEANAMWDRIPMVRIDGKLYYDTGRESIMDARTFWESFSFSLIQKILCFYQFPE